MAPTDSPHCGSEQCWRVVGGSDAGGILVRFGLDLQSQLHQQRLETGAVVQEIKQDRGRLQYRLVHGSGPEEGWVSVRRGSKDLMVKERKATASPNSVTHTTRLDNISRRPLSQLTYDERAAIHLDLLAEYSKLSFQQELHRAWNIANGDESKQLKMRWAVCWNVQAQIFKERGFDGSPHDVLQSHACISAVDSDIAELEAGAWLMWLIHPPAQVVHPAGPPLGAIAAEMVQASVPGFSSQLPKTKVLARVPCRHGTHEQYSICIVGAMTGELLCSADVAPSDRVCDLKRFICNLEGTPVAEQRLMLEGQLLQCEREEVASLVLRQHAATPHCADTRCLTLSLIRLTAERAALIKDLERGALDLEKVREDLRGDAECVLAAVKKHASSIQVASQALRTNRSFILSASKINGGILQYVDNWAQDDREIVLAAVQLEGMMLKYSSCTLKGDYELVRVAIEKDGRALAFAPEFFRSNTDIVLAAVRHCGGSLEHADYALKMNPRIVVAALKHDKEAAVPHVALELLQNYNFGATLEDHGFLEDGFFDGLFWASMEVAKGYFDSKKAVFLDARSVSAYEASHLEGAYSLPVLTSYNQYSNTEAFQAVLASGHSPVIVYSDIPSRPDLLLQMILRANPNVRKFRVLRLEGGLNLWKRHGHPVEGDVREMINGAPKSKLAN